MRQRSWWPLFWAIWIFATSCTVVVRSSFIRAIGQFLPQGTAQQEWSIGWMRFGLILIKGYHVGEYTVLCLLIFGALSSLSWSLPRALLCGTGASLAFAASDEWHQTFIPGRGGTWVDVCIDSLGIGLASWLILRRASKQSIEKKAIASAKA